MGIENYLISDKEKESTVVLNMYNPQTNKNVNLVAACHIGLPSYYAKIKSELNKNDKVLYELIKNKDSKKKTKMNNSQKLLAKYLNKYYQKKIKKNFKKSKVKKNLSARVLEAENKFYLTSQTEEINYLNLPKHWENADLDAREYLKSMFNEKGIVKYFFHNLPQVFLGKRFFIRRAAKKIINKGLLESFKKNKPWFEETDKKREEKVYEAIKRLEKKNNIKSIGIFYGAAHMERLENKLKKMGYKVRNKSYLTFLKKDFTKEESKKYSIAA